LYTATVKKKAVVRKTTEYSNFIYSHIFIPVTIETLGVWGPGAIESVNALGHRQKFVTADPGKPVASWDPRSQIFLRHRIDIAVQKGSVRAGHLPTRGHHVGVLFFIFSMPLVFRISFFIFSMPQIDI